VECVLWCNSTVETTWCQLGNVKTKQKTYTIILTMVVSCSDPPTPMRITSQFSLTVPLILESLNVESGNLVVTEGVRLTMQTKMTIGQSANLTLSGMGAVITVQTLNAGKIDCSNNNVAKY
jgi:hypothetical protein